MVFFWQSPHWHCQCCNKCKEIIKNIYGNFILNFKPWLFMSDPHTSSVAWYRNNPMWSNAPIQQNMNQILSLILIFKSMWQRPIFWNWFGDMVIGRKSLWTLIGENQLQEDKESIESVFNLYMYFSISCSMILVFSTEVGDSLANNPYNQGKPINTSEFKIPQKNKIKVCFWKTYYQKQRTNRNPGPWPNYSALAVNHLSTARYLTMHNL